MTAIVKYQVATYKGELEVECDENEESESIIARAKAYLTRRYGSVPFGYECWRVIERV